MLFEPAQGQAHRRLGDMQPHRGAAQAALVDDGQEGAQQVPVEPVGQQGPVQGRTLHHANV
ncbi:hypothetical protein D3C72_2148910 [compost metagenome]